MAGSLCYSSVDYLLACAMCVRVRKEKGMERERERERERWNKGVGETQRERETNGREIERKNGREREPMLLLHVFCFVILTQKAYVRELCVILRVCLSFPAVGRSPQTVASNLETCYSR